MEDINTAWMNFCDNGLKKEVVIAAAAPAAPNIIPQCSKLNISTKTQIAYLNSTIDLKTVFWNIPLVQYHTPNVGVVKKQMKFNSTTPEEVAGIIKQKDSYNAAYVDDYVIGQNHKPDGRAKFKDIRKISIGICKKDITSYRCKRKSAFYNCFVVILRLLINDLFKEIHVKVFNTGKLEIPGIKDSAMMDKVLSLLVEIMTPLVPEMPNAVLRFGDTNETVMINSNFTCGYYINRDKMYKLLKYKYKINSNFDPCSYPGIQCEFFFHDSPILKEQNGSQPSHVPIQNEAVTKVSFMVFRTGSVLIVGKCSEEMLTHIYNFLCTIFETEYNEIKCTSLHEPKTKEKTRKLRKKMITI
jgi:TATA-box binding protein (TBP) (component of TFIID and TFIIIB)